jgi:peptidoglycan/LPS O-acetylase OafA/YrhL
VAGAGYLGFNGFMVVSGFLFTYANVKMQQDFQASPEASTADSSAKFFSQYMPLFFRRVARIWPALMAAVFFVGFLFPYYINP